MSFSFTTFAFGWCAALMLANVFQRRPWAALVCAGCTFIEAARVFGWWS